MSKDLFDLLQQSLHSGGSEAGFDFLVHTFRQEKNYSLLFEARLMEKRHELGLALIQTEPWVGLSDQARRAYEDATMKAAREVGHLYLADGKIVRARPYFRAIGETTPIAEAIEQVEPQEGIDPIIEIAFHELVHPRKGLELILANYGICRAITSFVQYPGNEGREASAHLLVHTLYGELAENLKRIITKREGETPETESISELVTERDWLFEGDNYYIDTSHVISILQFSLELKDLQTLSLAVELTDYGKRLSPLHQHPGEPPFKDVFVDHGVYLRALLGQEVDAAVAHFRSKIGQGNASQSEGPAQVLVGFLARLNRHSEALEIYQKHLGDLDPNQLSCPSPLQLCQLAGNYHELRKLAREQGDLLSFVAATLQTSRS